VGISVPEVKKKMNNDRNWLLNKNLRLVNESPDARSRRVTASSSSNGGWGNRRPLPVTWLWRHRRRDA
jgi:hypothetical protein